MDAWGCVESIKVSDDSQENSFGDNFQPDSSKLPDSEEYLLKLENKLKKLKSGTNKFPKESKEIVDNLCSYRQGQYSLEDNTLEYQIGEVITSNFARKFYPEKYPITLDEIEMLLKADILDLKYKELCGFDDCCEER